MKRFLKILIGLLFTTGFILIGYALYHIWDGNNQVEKRIVEAKKIVEQNNNDSQIDPSSISYQQGETIGILKIPKLKKELPIIEGTDEEELEKGVGHYTGTAYPLQNDQIVLSGHRDTVFRNFGELETGDTFIVELEYGKFKYEIYEMDIVPADDTTVIRSTAPDEILTVTTCYPFHYIGNAPERAIFYAKPVSKGKE
ncbi:class D sortase [Caldifermentibacillus hisashii]|jgi:sortase A|uniref:class D sortase n=1 Tax=Caldifermentibacillus hisashii TaxID=996558 RepID=UPI001FD02CEE|nr:class D sortase [Caldifermentibacillus hisashii]MEC5273455.1 class D sortase [Caldifermentibacillus hisashii]MED4853230.1 class D sortase [Caldifermentibacillus hisashii]